MIKRVKTNTETIIVRVTPQLKNSLDALAKRQGMSISAFVRLVLHVYAEQAYQDIDISGRLEEIK